MSMEMMKKAVIGAAGAAAIMSAGAVQAAPNIYQGSSIVSSASATFSGTSVLTRTGAPNLTCTLTLDGTITRTSTGADIEVTGGNVSGGFLCNTLVNLGNFPWTATVLDAAAPGASTSNMPVAVQFMGVDAGLVCPGAPFAVNTTFKNGPTAGAVPNMEESSFEFASASLGPDCSVSGTLNVTDIADDIDVYDPAL